MQGTGQGEASVEATYEAAVAGEGAFWDNFVAQRLLRGELPGSIDWRLTFTQFRYNHKWLPLCLGPFAINFRLREIHYVLTQATRQPAARVLDLGCGAGWLSLELARRGAHVTALDISPTNLALGRHLAATNSRNFPYLYQGFAGLPCRLEDFGSVEYAYADLNAVDLPHAEYDAVIVWDSLHHVRDLERLLEQVRRALKPGGRLLGVDHAFATARTEAFNLELLPVLDDFYAWVTAADPQWLYETVNAAGRMQDLGLLAVDYDPTPVPGFDEFSRVLFAELLSILREGLQAEALEKVAAPQAAAGGPVGEEEESPFEDVSAERLARVLLETFQAERFTTVCPWIQPERHIPHYRTEAERIFQHYLGAAMLQAGEQAITRGQADGQWFLFDLAAGRPTAASPLLGRLVESGDRRQSYIEHLEHEIARKNEAITDLEQRLRSAEGDLVRARAPRLPWKRRR